MGKNLEQQAWSGLKKIKKMVSDETILDYPYWKILFTVYTDASEKQLGTIIIKYKKILIT